MPYCSASCWADVDTCGRKPLSFPLYSTLLEAKDLDHILTISGRILTDVASMRPSCMTYRIGTSVERIWRRLTALLRYSAARVGSVNSEMWRSESGGLLLAVIDVLTE